MSFLASLNSYVFFSTLPFFSCATARVGASRTVPRSARHTRQRANRRRKRHRAEPLVGEVGDDGSPATPQPRGKGNAPPRFTLRVSPARLSPPLAEPPIYDGRRRCEVVTRCYLPAGDRVGNACQRLRLPTAPLGPTTPPPVAARARTDAQLDQRRAFCLPPSARTNATGGVREAGRLMLIRGGVLLEQEAR